MGAMTYSTTHSQDEGGPSASCSGRIKPVKNSRYPYNKIMGGRQGYGTFEEEKLTRPHTDSIPGPSSPYLVALLTELSRLNSRGVRLESGPIRGYRH